MSDKVAKAIEKREAKMPSRLAAKPKPKVKVNVTVTASDVQKKTE